MKRRIKIAYLWSWIYNPIIFAMAYESKQGVFILEFMYGVLLYTALHLFLLLMYYISTQIEDARKRVNK